MVDSSSIVLYLLYPCYVVVYFELVNHACSEYHNFLFVISLIRVHVVWYGICDLVTALRHITLPCNVGELFSVSV